MEHSFDIDIAKEYGILEAVLLKNLWFWVAKNKANDTNFHDGYYWTYNSTKAFTELFPYATERQIKYALKRLRDEDVIQVGNYNQVAYDRTLWYSFTEKGQSIMQRESIHCTNLSDGNDSSVPPIPNINTDNKPSIKERKKTSYDEILSSIEDESLRETYLEYIKMRKLIKSPMTDKALTMLISKVNKLAPNNIAMQKEMLETAILNNWKSVYPPKNNQNNKQAPQGISNPFLRAAMQMGEE